MYLPTKVRGVKNNLGPKAGMDSLRSVAEVANRLKQHLIQAISGLKLKTFVQAKHLSSVSRDSVEAIGRVSSSCITLLQSNRSIVAQKRYEESTAVRGYGYNAITRELAWSGWLVRICLSALLRQSLV